MVENRQGHHQNIRGSEEFLGDVAEHLRREQRVPPPAGPSVMLWACLGPRHVEAWVQTPGAQDPEYQDDDRIWGAFIFQVEHCCYIPSDGSCACYLGNIPLV